MKKSYFDIYYKTEQQQKVINRFSPKEALAHYFNSCEAAKASDDIYGIAYNSAYIGDILHRYDVNDEAIKFYNQSLSSYDALISRLNALGVDSIETSTAFDFVGNENPKRKKKTDLIKRENIEHYILWNLLEISFVETFTGDFEDLDRRISDFKKKCMEFNYLVNYDLKSEIKNAGNSKKDIEQMRSEFEPVIAHHFKLLKLMREYRKHNGHICRENAEEYAEIMEMASPVRHMDYIVIIYYSVLDDENYALARKYLNRLKEMSSGAKAYELSYYQAYADYCLRVGDEEGFNEALEKTELIMNDKRTSYKRSRLTIMENEENEFEEEHTLRELASELLNYKDNAMTDALTKLPNRYAIYEKLPRILSRVAERKEKVGIVRIDIDRFKQFNDKYGHRVGDECLVAVADSIKKVYSQSFAARFGGDEFLVLLNKEDFANYNEKAEELRKTLSEVKLNDVEIPVTVTQGIAIRNAARIKDWQVIFENADESLYKGKNKSRDCIIISNR